MTSTVAPFALRMHR